LRQRQARPWLLLCGLCCTSASRSITSGDHDPASMPAVDAALSPDRASAAGTGGPDAELGTGGGPPATGGSQGATGGAAGTPDASPDLSPADTAPSPADAAITGGLCTAGDCRALAGNFDGFLYDHPCSDGGRGFDCAGPMCVGGTSTHTQAFAIKGDPGKVYELTFKVRGIVEAKNYQDGKRRATGLDPGATGGDLWYEGGTAPLSTYNSYELHVTPKVAGAPNDYFLNSRDGSTENHQSWALNYSATIKVQGGGTITFRAFDSNCRHIMNCGPGVGSTTSKCVPRTLDLSGAVPPAPASFVQPPKNAQGATGQWLFIDVTSVRSL
jgi:hypothetical protein